MPYVAVYTYEPEGCGPIIGPFETEKDAEIFIESRKDSTWYAYNWTVEELIWPPDFKEG